MLHPQPTTRTQPTDQTRTSTHRRVTAYALAGSAVLVGVSGLVSPAHNGDADGLLTAATTAPARVTAGAVILIVSSALFVVGVLGAAHVVRARAGGSRSPPPCSACWAPWATSPPPPSPSSPSR